MAWTSFLAQKRQLLPKTLGSTFREAESLHSSNACQWYCTLPHTSSDHQEDQFFLFLRIERSPICSQPPTKSYPLISTSNKDQVPLAASNIQQARTLSSRTVQNMLKEQCTIDRKIFLKKKQTGGMSTRTVNQDNFAVLACCFTSWRKAKKVCEVYLWYTSGVTHLLQWGVAEWFGPELVRVTCMCLPQSSRAGTLTAPTSSVPC